MSLFMEVSSSVFQNVSFRSFFYQDFEIDLCFTSRIMSCFKFRVFVVFYFGSTIVRSFL